MVVRSQWTKKNHGLGLCLLHLCFKDSQNRIFKKWFKQLNVHFQLDKVRLTVNTHLKKKLEENDAIGIPGKLELLIRNISSLVQFLMKNIQD